MSLGEFMHIMVTGGAWVLGGLLGVIAIVITEILNPTPNAWWNKKDK